MVGRRGSVIAFVRMGGERPGACASDWRRAAAIGLSLLLCGCAVGPDFLPPAPPPASGYTQGPSPKTTASAKTSGGAAQHFRRNRDIRGDWWTLFRSAGIKKLVAEALKNNQDLVAAQ